MYRFELSPGEMAKLAEWAAEQDAIVLERQKERGEEGNRPYYGSIGGELTYSFTPTSLGVITKVEHGVTKNVLDLTEYEYW